MTHKILVCVESQRQRVMYTNVQRSQITVSVTYRQECPTHERQVNCRSEEQDAMVWGALQVWGKPWIYLES